MVLSAFCYLGRGVDAWRPDLFYGFLHGGNLKKGHLLELLETLSENDICELMCHPGLEDRNSPYLHWNYHWQDELNMLLDPDFLNVLDKKKVSLVSYRDLLG